VVRLVIIAVLLSGCASLNPNGKFADKCGVPYLRAPTLSQLDCMDKLGAQDPSYKPDTRRRELLEGQIRYQFEQQLGRIQIVAQKLEDPIGATVRAPGGIDETVIKEKIRLFCEENEKANWDIVEIKQGKDYLGNTGRDSSYCTQYGCWGSNNSTAVYAHYNDVSFRCKTL